MDETIITLKSGVMLTEHNVKTSLTLNGQTRYANNAIQSELLRALATKPQPLEVMMNTIYARGDPSYSESEVSLAMAEFILDFGEYLES